MDLEHLSTGNKTINLRLSASLSTVKELIQSILPLNDGFKEAAKWKQNPKFGSQKINSFVIKKP